MSSPKNQNKDASKGKKAPKVREHTKESIKLLDILSRDFLNFVNNESMSDVQFLLGKDKKKLNAHRFIFAVRAKTFANKYMEDKGKKGKVIVELPHVSPEVFKIIVKYLYGGVADLAEDNVMQVATAAEEFNMASLSDICERFIATSLNNESKQLEFLEVTYNTGMKIYKEVFAIVARNAQKLFKTAAFVHISAKHLAEILQSDQLNVSEADLFSSVMGWANSPRQLELAKREMERKGERDSKKNPIQEILLKMLPHIRFPLMTPEELAEVVEPTGIVPMKYLLEAYKFHTLPVPPKKCTHKRFYKRKPVPAREQTEIIVRDDKPKESPKESPKETPKETPKEEVKEEVKVEEKPADEKHAEVEKKEEETKEENVSDEADGDDGESDEDESKSEHSEDGVESDEDEDEDEDVKEVETFYWKEGPQTNVAIEDLKGWKKALSKGFAKGMHGDELAQLAGKKVLIGVKKKKEDVLLLCAMGEKDVILQKCPSSKEAATQHNGVWWYLSNFKNAKAFGFAPSKEIELRNVDKVDPDNETRLSWSLSGTKPGGRAGKIVLGATDEDSAKYEKVAFVPEEE